MATAVPLRPISIAKPAHGSKGGGVLPASSMTDRSRLSNTLGSFGKATLLRLKVVVRRLAPGLTEEEFTTALGEEWKVGSGKVDWVSYKIGKTSKE